MIRPYKESDLEQVYDIYYREEVHPFMYFKRLALGDFKKAWDDALKEKAIFVLEEGGRVMGFVGLAFGGGMVNHVAFIRTFAVRPEEQGKGYGKELFDFVTREAVRRGAEKIQMEVEADNEKAIAFYKRRGFAEEGRMKNYTKRETGYVDDLIMSKFVEQNK